MLVVWVLGWAIFHGTATLELGGAELTGFHDLAQRASATRSTRPAQGSFFFEYIIGGISAVIDAIVTGLRELLSQPAFPRPVPEIGWLGVVASFTWLAYALAGLRSAVLVLVGLLLFGFLGYWARQHRHADRHVRGGAGVRDHRHPDGHLDGPQPPGRRR